MITSKKKLISYIAKINPKLFRGGTHAVKHTGKKTGGGELIKIYVSKIHGFSWLATEEMAFKTPGEIELMLGYNFLLNSSVNCQGEEESWYCQDNSTGVASYLCHMEEEAL